MEMTPMQAGFVIMTGLSLYLGLIALPRVERRVSDLEGKVEDLERRIGDTESGLSRVHDETHALGVEIDKIKNPFYHQAIESGDGMTLFEMDKERDSPSGS